SNSASAASRRHRRVSAWVSARRRRVMVMPEEYRAGVTEHTHSDSGMIPDEFREPPGSEPGDPMSAITDASGPSDATDLDAVLALTNTERDAVIHTVQNNAPSIFTWDYEKASRPALNKLY